MLLLLASGKLRRSKAAGRRNKPFLKHVTDFQSSITLITIHDTSQTKHWSTYSNCTYDCVRRCACSRRPSNPHLTGP